MQQWRACATLVAAMFFASPVGAQEGQAYTYDVHGRLAALHRDTASASTVTAYGLDSADNRAARTTGPTMTAIWEAEALNHYTGYAQDEGWEANAQQPSSLLIAGPYTTTVPTGSRVAVWKMMVGPQTAYRP